MMILKDVGECVRGRSRRMGGGCYIGRKSVFLYRRK